MNGEVQHDLLKRSVTNVQKNADKTVTKHATKKNTAKSKVAQNIKVVNKVKTQVVQ